MGLRVVILGAPGAGKGTQAARMAQAYDLPHVSTGDIFRAHLKEGTDLGGQVRQYLDAGRLVPDELTCDIVAERLGENDCAQGYILDGFPRTLAQAKMLDQLLAEWEKGLDLALSIDVADSEIVERLTARRLCPRCGAIYNLKFGPSKKGAYCERESCEGVELVQRGDDKEETIRERLNVYHDVTEPIVAYYEKQALLKTIVATGQSPDNVFARIEEIVSGGQEA